MTKLDDFVYSAIMREARSKGALDRFAVQQAELARAAYRENRFTKPSKLIMDAVKKAVQDSKKHLAGQLGGDKR